MDFVAINLFLMLYYIRPHEWIGLVQSIRLTAFSLIFAIIATVMRERGFHLKDLLRTPHDWMMVIYIGWIIIASHAPLQAWQNLYPYLVYYFVAVEALSNLKRIQWFLGWWTFMIFAVSVFALLGEIGFDFTDAHDITHGVMKNRLVLNTSIFNNPNALGHSIVPALVMIYFLGMWKRPIFSKIFTVPFLAMPILCIYLTVSKGAFVAAFCAIVVALTFNRPKLVQIFILGSAATIGWTAMHWLPRMNELDQTSRDQAIQGRKAAFTFGLAVLHGSIRGVGYENFASEFTKVNHYEKAPHSSYVEIGAEFGWIGLTLFLGMLYCSYRTLITCKTHSIEEERIRRMLFTLLVTYTVSSWMVDFAFRAAMFLMIAAIGAFHRHLLGFDREPATLVEKEKEAEAFFPLGVPSVQPAFPAPAPAGVPVSFPMQPATAATVMPSTITVTPVAGTEEPGMQWNSIGLVDIGMIIIISIAWERLWKYIIHNV